MTSSKKSKFPKLKMPGLNLKLKMKILLGFSTTIAILMIVVGFGYKSFVTVGHEVELYSEYVEEATIVSEIESDFLKLEIYAVEYALTGEAELAEKAKKAIEVLNHAIKSSLEHVKGPADLETLKEISHLAHVYEKDFEKITHLVAEADSLIHDKLHPIGDKFVKDLDLMMKLVVAEGNAPAIKILHATTRHAIEARRYSAMALAGQDKKAFDHAEHEFEYLHKSLEKLAHVAHTPEEVKLEKEMVELLATYKVSFETAVKDKHHIDELLHGEMAQQAKKLLADTKLLKDKLVLAEGQIREQTNADIVQAEMMMLMVGLVGLIVGVVTALVLGTQISKPVVAMTKAMRELAEGELDTEIPAKNRKDEIGQMSEAVQVFKDNAIRSRELESHAEEQKQSEEAEKRRMMNQLAEDFDGRIGGIVETVSAASAELNATAQSMASIAEETSIQANSVSEASERASNNVQTVASATEEMANSISEINQQVVNASEVSKKAVEDVSGTAKQMESLAQTADKIGDVISMISDIAEQTNLLALNATIESARAGEAGKGFAVVATEVKALANETAKATENISNLITEIQGQTQGAVTAISDIGTVINKLEETSSAIAAAMTEQGATTQEVARNVEEASVGTQEVTANISGVTQASQESGAAAGEVTTAASELSKQAEIMKTEVSKFLGEIREA